MVHWSDGGDFSVDTAMKDRQLVCLTDLPAETNTTGTESATVCVQAEIRADLLTTAVDMTRDCRAAVSQSGAGDRIL
jgi:hypothetical protein